jgi:hypothetical protein
MQITHHNNTIAFDSMADMHRYMSTVGKTNDIASDSWYGGMSASQSIKSLLTGDMSQVPAAQRLLNKFDIRISTEGQEMDLGVAGFLPCVPEYIGGAPESMFTMAECESVVQPLKIMVDTTSSAGIGADVLTKRGTTILAAVMALSATRPVELEATCILDCSSSLYFGKCKNYNISICRTRINSSPLDLASACFALCHQGYTRRMVYGIVQKEFGSPLAWGSIPGIDMRNTREPAVLAKCLELLGCDDSNGIYIPPSFLHDPIVKDPEAWVKDVLNKYSN